MPNDRRRFLSMFAVGLTTVLVPKVSFAGLFHRRCRRGPQTTVATPTYATAPINVYATPCQLAGINWSSQAPSIPDTYQMTTSPNQHQFTVYGTGLVNWVQNGGFFIPSVQDNIVNSPVTWTPVDGSQTIVPGNGTTPDALSFMATETGSTPNVTSTITITITLSTGRCQGKWQAPVKYA